MDRETRFWALAAALMEADPGLERGTMMGSACLRVHGEFAAMIHAKTEQVIVKLPAARVIELIDQGTGDAFAPNGRVFKEWLAVTAIDDKAWRSLLAEACAFARPAPP